MWVMEEKPFGRFKRKKVIRDESTRHIDRRIGNHTLSKCAKLALSVQRYGSTMKQGEPTDSVQARNLCKHTIGGNIHQRKNHKAD